VKKPTSLRLIRNGSAPAASPAASAEPPPPLVAPFLAAMRELMRPLVRAELAAALDEQRRHLGTEPLDLVDGDRSPLGKRRHHEACRAGRIPGARKLGRRWLAPRASVLAFVDGAGKAPAVAPLEAPAPPPDDDLDELLGECGLVQLGKGGAR
jgi:hypothetical protein